MADNIMSPGLWRIATNIVILCFRFLVLSPLLMTRWLVFDRLTWNLTRPSGLERIPWACDIGKNEVVKNANENCSTISTGWSLKDRIKWLEAGASLGCVYFGPLSVTRAFRKSGWRLLGLLGINFWLELSNCPSNHSPIVRHVRWWKWVDQLAFIKENTIPSSSSEIRQKECLHASIDEM